MCPRRDQQEGEDEREKSVVPIELAVEKIPADFASACLKREQGTQRVHRPEAKESTKKRGKMERSVIWIFETAKREASNRNNVSEPEKSTTFLRSYGGRFISQRATKSKLRGSAVILGPALTFLPP